MSAKKNMTGDPGKAQGGKSGTMLGLLLGLLLGLAASAGAFYGVSSGLVPLPWLKDEAASEDTGTPWEPPSYVELAPIIVPLGQHTRARHLRASLVLDVEPGREEDVTSALPRIRDILNVYLRALDERDIESPALTMRMRAQMLQQVRMVAPEKSIKAVLLREFLLS